MVAVKGGPWSVCDKLGNLALGHPTFHLMCGRALVVGMGGELFFHGDTHV